MLRPLILLIAVVALLSAGDAPPDPAALQKRIAELEAEVAVLRQQSVTFKALADADVDIWVRAPGDDAAPGIPAAIADLLALNADERAALKKAVDQARAEVTEQIAAQKPMAQVVDNGFRLVIQDFGDEGKLIEGQMQKTFKAVLGPDRQRLLKRLTRFGNDLQFLAFGEGTQTFTFTRQDGRWSCRHETRSAGRSGSSSGSLGNSLARYALIRPYLPKELIEGVEGPAKPKDDAQPPKGADNF